jgi:hypothetical protein
MPLKASVFDPGRYGYAIENAERPDDERADAPRRRRRLGMEHAEPDAPLLHRVEEVAHDVGDRARDDEHDEDRRQPGQAVEEAVAEPGELVDQPFVEPLRERRGHVEAAEDGVQPRVDEGGQHEPLDQHHAGDREAGEELAPVDVREARRQDVALLLHPDDGDAADAVRDPDEHAEQQRRDGGADRAAQQPLAVVELVPHDAHLLESPQRLPHERIEVLLRLRVDVGRHERDERPLADDDRHALETAERRRQRGERRVDRRRRQLAQALLRPLHALLRREAADARAQHDDVAVEDAQRRRLFAFGRGGGARRAGTVRRRRGRGAQRESDRRRERPASARCRDRRCFSACRAAQVVGRVHRAARSSSRKRSSASVIASRGYAFWVTKSEAIVSCWRAIGTTSAQWSALTKPTSDEPGMIWS